MARGLDRAALARNVKQFRLACGWSQEMLAGEANELRQAMISEIEARKANPTLATLEDIASALGVTVYDLFRPPRKRS